MDKICGIYKITNLINNKTYIGESTDIIKRWYMYKKLHCKNQIKLYRSFTKYGVQNHKFEVIMYCDYKDLKYFESCFQEIYNCIEKGLNLKYTGRDEIKGKCSNETKNKIRQSLIKAFKNPKIRKKISESKKGKKYSEEAKKNMSEAQKKLHKSGYIHPMKKKLHSEKCKQKMKDNHWSKRKDFVSPNAKKVINLKDGIIYNSVKLAWQSQQEVRKYNTFIAMLTGQNKNKTTYKYYEN
jgi:group I intron endonuclease